MRIGFKGQLEDRPEIKIGGIGCGSHSFRNLYPVYQFTPTDLVATCDLDEAKAEAYASKFGAENSYTDYRRMIEKENLDGVVVCVGYDTMGRPMYPQIAADCMKLGVNVFIEKPPAAFKEDVELMMEASEESGRILVCGLKRQFFPTTTKAKKLISDNEKFGDPMLLSLFREEFIPTVDEMKAWKEKGVKNKTGGFLDHFCHPSSRLLYLFGMPKQFIYHRAPSGAGVATYEYEDGRIATMTFTKGGSGVAGGVERVTIVGTKWQTVVIENCRVIVFQGPLPDEGAEAEGYGAKVNYYTGEIGTTTAVWEPEFTLGQLYSKGIVQLGYYDEILEFANAIMEKRQPTRGTLLQCWQMTHMFEQFMEGPGRMITLSQGPSGRSNQYPKGISLEAQ